MSSFTAAYTSAAASATGITKRSVSDSVRNLFPGAAVLFALVSMGEMNKGELTKQAGLLGKRAVETPRFECFTYTPLAVKCVVTSFSGTTLVVDSTVNIRPWMTLFNAADGTTAKIDSVTSSTVLEITSFGTSAFNPSALDVLLICGVAAPQNSNLDTATNTPMSFKDLDNVYNVLQTMRYPVAASRSAILDPTYGGNYWTETKKRNIIEANIKAEKTIMFGNRPSSGDTTSGGAVNTASFPSARGIYQWAYQGGYTKDMQAQFTPSRFRNDAMQSLSSIIGNQDKVIGFCGNATFAQMLEWQQDPWRNTSKGGSYEIFGVKSNRFATSKADVELIVHDAFNYGALATQMLLFSPDNINYIHKIERDLQPNPAGNIASPSTDGEMTEIIGEISCEDVTGGLGSLILTNLR